VAQWLDQRNPDLVKAYKHFHANPELSFQELKTAALIGKELDKAGYEVTTGVGRTGVVAVLKNGEGPTLLIRGDMDALPIIEETGLDYASKVLVKQPDGTEVGAMHACGHDVHCTMLFGIGPLLADLREHWSGTVVLIAQPAEEIGRGSRFMIEDGLFERFPKPDICLSLHVMHKLPIGTVGLTSGWAFANVDSVDITIYGKGGHGARPHSSVDPIVTAAHVITQLQTIVSRRLAPVDPGVITVGSIRGGTKHNIIPDEVKMQLTVRSYTDEVRRTLLDGIRQVTTDTCRTFQCPKDPLVEVDEEEFTPAAYNDPDLTEAAAGLFRELLGEENVFEMPQTMGGEDFGRFARHLGVPGLQYRIGTVSRESWEASQEPGADPLPSLHSAKYYPLPEPTVRLSVESMANLALALLAK
jgi:hippurate hydrolase